MIHDQKIYQQRTLETFFGSSDCENWINTTNNISSWTAGATQKNSFTEYTVFEIISVRPILHIGEYSLVALQYRRIRYIGLRVSADTDTPAAITITVIGLGD